MKILVPIDGSENSMKAIEKAIELGEQNDNAKILLLTVVNSQKDNPYIIDQDYTSELSIKNIENGKRILADGVNLTRNYNGVVETMLRNGDIAENIIDVAEDDGYDLIIMGRRGMSISARSLLGSVSNKVLNYANKSVLVVK